MITSRDVFTDEHGRRYREILEENDNGGLTCVGRLMEPVEDTRQQPKSLSFRIMEERYGKD